jgi:hypothetical protein
LDRRQCGKRTQLAHPAACGQPVGCDIIELRVRPKEWDLAYQSIEVKPHVYDVAPNSTQVTSRPNGCFEEYSVPGGVSPRRIALGNLQSGVWGVHFAGVSRNTVGLLTP